MTELPADLHEQIKRLCADGDGLANSGLHEQAIATYKEAWKLVPEPKTEWEASTWVLAAIGEAAFTGAFYSSGVDALQYALHCPGGAMNPFVHLRLGQCEFERDKPDIAAEHLARAYMLDGKAIFSRESPKYFDFLKTRLKPPVSGQW
jgi:hypothetical protein